MKASSYLITGFLGAALGFPASASESEAREVFSAAVTGALSFSGDRVVDDVSISFIHFTKEGREALVSELERTGMVAQAVNRRAAVRTDLPSSAIEVSRRVGGDGLEEYQMRGTVTILWSKCDAKGCVTSGDGRKARVSGTVVSAVLNGRPGYRVATLILEGAGK